MTSDMKDEATITELTDSIKLDANQEAADFVDPWNVTSASDTGINYDKLIGK